MRVNTLYRTLALKETPTSWIHSQEERCASNQIKRIPLADGYLIILGGLL